MRVDLSKLSIADIVAQKERIISDKKSLVITSEPIIYSPEAKRKQITISKAAGSSDNPNEIEVVIIGNTFKFCDSHMDVLGPGCADKTIRERGISIKHLKDHLHTIGGKIGKTLDVFTDLVSVSEFGIVSDVKTTESLFMRSLVKKVLDAKSFELYKEEEIDQHSIGMQYVNLELAVNNEEFKDEFEIWQKRIGDVINKEFVENRGFFWWVSEIKLFEISAVLFGANELTPTVSTGKSTQEPLEGTLAKKNPKPPTDTLDDEEKRKLLLMQNN